MDQRIKAEDKINRLIFDHVERASIVHMVGQILETPEAGPTGVNAAWGDVDQRQAGGIRLQELGPAAISGAISRIFSAGIKYTRCEEGCSRTTEHGAHPSSRTTHRPTAATRNLHSKSGGFDQRCASWAYFVRLQQIPRLIV